MVHVGPRVGSRQLRVSIQRARGTRAAVADCMRNFSLVTLTLLLALTTSAFAGRKLSWPVTIDLVAHQAWGSLGSARNSPDTIQQLGCSVHYDAGNKKNNVNCIATDSTKTSVQCSSQQPELVQIAL